MADFPQSWCSVALWTPPRLLTCSGTGRERRWARTLSLPVNPFLSCLLFLFLCAGSQSRHTNFYLWHASAELRASLVAQMVKILPAVQKTWVRSLGWEDPLQKGTATRSSILAWRIPWAVELCNMGSQRVGHDWATFTFVVWMMHPAQSATGSWVMPGLVYKWLPFWDFSLFNTP